jgi:type II secretory pathway pseudopilin PulG
VVAIIGLLAATILASLGQARKKARISRTQSEMSSMRAAAELYYTGNGSFNGVFQDTASGMANLLADVISPASGNTYPSPNTSSNSWGIEVTLPDGSKYCSDSNGFNGPKTLAVDSNGDYYCQ